jgi:hypothetical protein
MSSDMSLPNPSSPGVEDRQILHNQVIDEAGPGTVLDDFEVLLRFIGPEGIVVGGKNDLLPMKVLPQLNAQLTHPIEIGLKRPQQKSYPHINSLYLLLRATGLAYLERTRISGVLRLDDAVLQSWRNLNPTERYFTILEAWLLRSRSEVLGERDGWLDLPMLKWADFFRKVPARGLTIAGNKDQELLIGYSPGLYTVALLELFGFIAVQASKPEAGKGWRIAWVRRTSFGDAMLQLLSGLLLSDEFFARYDSEPGVAFGELQTTVQPFFPEWRQNLTLLELAFQDGVYIFKVSLGSRVWRRIALSGRDDFEDLSSAILQAFDFDNDHLYRFTYKNRFGVPVGINHPYMDEPPFTSEVQVGEIGIKPGTTMTYLFDFGDHWEFELALEGIEPVAPKFGSPRILETRGEAPKQYPAWDDEGDG